MKELLEGAWRILVVTLAAPLALRSKVRELLMAAEEVPKLQGHYDHAMGMLDEARVQEHAATRAQRALVTEIVGLDARIKALADESRVVGLERDAARADVQELTDRLAVVTTSCAELQGEVDTARAYRSEELRTSLLAANHSLTALGRERDIANERATDAERAAERAKAFRKHAEEEANTMRAERSEVEWLRRETGWPEGNDASWILNLIADKDATIKRLLTERDAQGTTP